jgi:hypothetical protein
MAMGLSLLFLFQVIVSIGLVAWSVALAREMLPQTSDLEIRAWLVPWGAKGLLAPFCIWALMNIGISWTVPAYMPQLQVAQNAGVSWGGLFVRILGNGWLVISSLWGSATVAWALVLAATSLEGEKRKEFKGICWIAGGAMTLVAFGILVLGGWSALGVAAFSIVAPIAAYAPGMLFKRPVPPMYARAVAKMKRGQYSEAEWEIIKQLETCEDDYDGWMMMATLYAEHFHDLEEAEQTILEISDQPRTTPSQISVALHKLADWYLKLRTDPDSARRALQIICDRAPGTHLARMARVRMNQIGMTIEDVREQQTPSAIPLPALGDAFDAEDLKENKPSERAQALRTANDCVERLRLDPNNTTIRERFARVLADQLDSPDKAIDQLQLLVGLSSQPESKRAEWMGLIAAFHLKHRKDTEAGRAVLEKIVNEFPRLPQALAARRRLQLLDREGLHPKASL